MAATFFVPILITLLTFMAKLTVPPAGATELAQVSFSPTPLQQAAALTEPTLPATAVQQPTLVVSLAANPEPTQEPYERITPAYNEVPSAYRLPQDLSQYMVDMINNVRTAEGLGIVMLDSLASSVAQAHAEEMAQYGYLSHWNLMGYGPDVRYNLAGGTEKVRENVYSYRRTFQGTPVPVTSWEEEVEVALDNLLDSPMHEVNIMATGHTHVGIGMAYDTATGEFRVAQEFFDRYVVIEEAPRSARPGDVITLRGRLLAGASDPVLNLSYERLPRPMSLEALRIFIPYSSPAQYLNSIPILVNEDGSFQIDVALREFEGMYHIRIWVVVNGIQVLVTDYIVWVTQP